MCSLDFGEIACNKCPVLLLLLLKEDMQEVGGKEDEVFGCGEGGHA